MHEEPGGSHRIGSIGTLGPLRSKCPWVFVFGQPNLASFQNRYPPPRTVLPRPPLLPLCCLKKNSPARKQDPVDRPARPSARHLAGPTVPRGGPGHHDPLPESPHGRPTQSRHTIQIWNGGMRGNRKGGILGGYKGGGQSLPILQGVTYAPRLLTQMPTFLRAVALPPGAVCPPSCLPEPPPLPLEICPRPVSFVGALFLVAKHTQPVGMNSAHGPMIYTPLYVRTAGSRRATPKIKSLKSEHPQFQLWKQFLTFSLLGSKLDRPLLDLIPKPPPARSVSGQDRPSRVHLWPSGP